MRRHAIPATLTSSGHVSQAWVPGEADALTGPPRWREVYARFRRQRSRLGALRCTVAAWRHGVTLSGSGQR